MTKSGFTEQLRKRLSGIPEEELSERLDFYCEIIDDRMEEGFSEEEAVDAVGNIEDIAKSIISEVPLAKIAKERIKPKRRLKPLEIVLIAVGSPIWLALGAALLAIIICIYAVLWSLLISLWAVFVALAASSLGAVGSGICFIVFENAPVGIAMLGAGIACAGLSILLFLGCRAASRGVLWISKMIPVGIKNCFIKKERA